MKSLQKGVYWFPGCSGVINKETYQPFVVKTAAFTIFRNNANISESCKKNVKTYS